jgi:hypothetical protein
MKDLIRNILQEQRKWSKEIVQNIANNYQTKTDFFKNNQPAYGAAKKYGWFDEVTSHMTSKQIRWTEDMIRAEASKYKTKSDFVLNSPKAADRARYYGIWDDVTKNMEVLGDLYKRLVYVYEFPNKVVYVGLTHDKTERDYLHKIKGPVYKYIKETGVKPTLKVVSDDYIDAKDAQNLEDCTIQFYKNNGWTLLNTAKAGSLGMCKVFWTKDKVKLEIEKYNTLDDFRKKSNKAYTAALRNNWLDELITNLEKRRTIWTDDELRQEIKQYENIQDLQNKAPNIYSAIIRRKNLKYLLDNLERKKRNWTDEELKKEAIKYDSIKDLQSVDNSLYVTIISRLGKNFLHDLYGTTLKQEWNVDKIRQVASQYDKLSDFKKNNEYAYKLAKSLGILDDVSKDMIKHKKWDIDSVTKESKKYTTKMDFKKGSRGAYNVAVNLKILNQLFPLN